MDLIYSNEPYLDLYPYICTKINWMSIFRSIQCDRLYIGLILQDENIFCQRKGCYGEIQVGNKLVFWRLKGNADQVS